MANMNSWATALKLRYKQKPTTQTYSEISALGLETVSWEEVKTSNSDHLLNRARKFIRPNSPCLFIWDPRDKSGELEKGYLSDLLDKERVAEWVQKNRRCLGEYNFLLTTQITNPGNGYVGTAFSDGKGRLLVETLHQEGVYNHRVLSQGNASADSLDHFVADEFEFVRGRIPNLRLKGAKKIIENFSIFPGYFEFVVGMQTGSFGVYTTGYEKSKLFGFPEEQFEQIYFMRKDN